MVNANFELESVIRYKMYTLFFMLSDVLIEFPQYDFVNCMLFKILDK